MAAALLACAAGAGAYLLGDGAEKADVPLPAPPPAPESDPVPIPAAPEPPQEAPIPEPPEKERIPQACSAGLLVTVISGWSDRPVPGASVEVYDGKDRIAECTADSEGRARIVIPARIQVTVVARAPGQVRGFKHPDPLPEGGTSEVSVRVQSGEPWKGVVLDGATGRPVAGAVVRVLEAWLYVHPWCGTGRVHRPVPPVDQVVSDADGKFSFLWGQEFSLTLTVEAAGYLQGKYESSEFDAEKWRRPAEVRLSPGATLRGRVLGPDGRPVPGARVFAIARNDFDLDPRKPLEGLRLDKVEMEEGWFESHEEVFRTRRARADDQGRYALHGLAAGASYHAYACGPGLAPSEPIADVLAPTPESVVERDFRLRRAASVEVRLDGGGETPPDDTGVRIESPGRRVELGRAGPDLWTGGGLAPGPWKVVIESPGRVPAIEQVHLAEGVREVVPVRLDEGCALEGVVVDDTGAPLADAEVRPLYAGEEEDLIFRWPRERATTDSEGRFRVAGLRPAKYKVVVAGMGGNREPLVATAPASGLRVEVPRKGGIRCRFSLPEGRDRSLSIRFSLKTATLETCFSRTFASEAVFESEPLSAGPLTCTFAAEGAVPVVREVEVLPGRQVDLGTVHLERGLRVSGRVVDDEGKPAEFVTVHWGPDLSLSLPDHGVASLDSEGRFELRHVPRGPQVLEFRIAYMTVLRATVNVEEGMDVPTFKVDRPGSIRGTVVDREGRPVRGVSVRAKGRDGAPDVAWDQEYRTDEEGGFWMDVPSGKYGLLLVRSGEIIPSDEVFVAKGACVSVRLVLPERGSVPEGK